MNLTRHFLYLAIIPLLIVPAKPLHAEIQVVNQVLYYGESWSVPADKILLLTAAITANVENNHEIYVYPGGGTNLIFLECRGQIQKDFQPLCSPIPFVGGTRFEPVITDGFGNGFAYILFGKLVDESDLFASIPSEIEGGSQDGDMLQFAVLKDSPRPARIDVEESTDLKIWHPSTNAVASGGGQSGSIEITKTANPRAILRTKVIARPGG